MRILHRSLFVVALAAPLAAHGQTFFELESVTTMEPAAEYFKIARLGQDVCNVSRELLKLPRHPPPTLPMDFVHERIWTVSNGRDFVLRTRRFVAGPAGPLREEPDCRWVEAWSEQIVIQRGGTTTRISRSSDGPPEIERNAFSVPWKLDPVDSHPLRANAMGLALRCATPEALQATGILQPMIGMREICIPERPVFRNEDGFNLVVQSTADASFFGGRGGEFRAVQRVNKYGVYNATDRTWNPQTYLSD